MYWTDSPVTVYPLYILGGFWPFWGRRTLKEKYYAIDLFQTRRRPDLPIRTKLLIGYMVSCLMGSFRTRTDKIADWGTHHADFLFFILMQINADLKFSQFVQFVFVIFGK